MQVQFENEYDAELEKQKILKKAEFILAKILRAIFSLIKLLLKLTWDVAKGVLRTFGIRVG